MALFLIYAWFLEPLNHIIKLYFSTPPTVEKNKKVPSIEENSFNEWDGKYKRWHREFYTCTDCQQDTSGSQIHHCPARVRVVASSPYRSSSAECVTPVYIDSSIRTIKQGDIFYQSEIDKYIRFDGQNLVSFENEIIIKDIISDHNDSDDRKDIRLK